MASESFIKCLRFMFSFIACFALGIPTGMSLLLDCCLKTLYFLNLYGVDVRKWIPNPESKFHENPTVNESMILVLLRQVWVHAGKKKAQCERYFSHHRHYFTNSNNEDMLKWVGNHMFKFYNDPTVNESGIVVLLR